MIQVNKDKDNVFISITTKLDREDVYQLVSDLNKWLDETVEEKRLDNQNAGPSGIKFHNQAHTEAFQQAQKKRLLEESMKEYIASIKSTQHIQKEVQTFEFDALNREVQVTITKLKENGRNNARKA